MTEEKKSTGHPVLTALVVILLIVVGVQGYFLRRMYHQTAWPGHRMAGPVFHRFPWLAAHQAHQHRLQPASSAPALAGSTASSLWRSPWTNPNGSSWDPFGEMERMREEMDQMFQDSMDRFWSAPAWGPRTDESLAFAPRMDLRDEAKDYVVTFDLPGADKSKIDVRVDGRQLTVPGSIHETVEEKGAGKALSSERLTGGFERSITLPGPVQSENLTAKYDNGVLKVTIPKEPENVRPTEHVTVL
jgi:HSP20 family protein